MEPKYYGAAASYNKPVGGGPLFSRKLLVVGGLVLGVIIFLVVALSVINGISQGPRNDFVRLVARQTALQTLMEEQKEKIGSSNLRALNATALILAKGDVAALTTQMQTAYGVKEVPQNIAAMEADPAVKTELENASLSGAFDRTYVDVLRQKIANTYALAQKIYDSGGSANVRAALQHQLENLAAIDEQLSTLEL